MTALATQSPHTPRESADRGLIAATKPAEHGILHYIGLGLSGGLLGLMLLLAAAVIVVPAVTGSTAYTVLTSSMEPKLPPGTLIVDRPVVTEDIRVGDVITYQLESGKPSVVTHRVSAITTTDTGAKLFTLKGDNNSQPDADLVLPAQIRGTLWYSVPLVGWVNVLVSGPARGWVIPVLAGGLFAYAGFMGASALAGHLTKRRDTVAARNQSDLP